MTAASPDEPAVQVECASRSPCLERFSLAVARGERVVLLGENGVGKTTLLRLVAGLAAPQGGSVRAPGPVGYVAQDHRASLLPWLRARDNVALPLRGARLDRSAIDRGVAEAAARAGLASSLLARWPAALSGGEQQRVALARALCGAPRLLLLDEPFSALDAAARPLARAAVRRFAEERGAAVLLVTHDLDDAIAIGQRALVVGGRPLSVLQEVRGHGEAPLDRAALLAALASASGEPARAQAIS